MRSSVRLFAAALVCAVVAFVRPSLAENFADNVAPGIVGEVSAIAGEADPRTGALTQTIPIALPPARGLPQPALALQYNSSWRDREAGYGWGLDLPVIERRVLSGFPEFDSAGTPIGDERYVFDGKPLVRLCQVVADDGCAEPNTEGHPAWAKSDGGWWYYRLQVEGTYARFYRSNDRRTWRVLVKGGERLEFGHLREDTDALGTMSAMEHDIAPPNAGIVRWRLVAQKDPQHPKNVVLYRWQRAAPFATTSLLYLTDVYFTPPASGTASSSSFAHHVQLDWEDLPFTVTKYLAAERARLPVRLKRIAVASVPWDVTGGPSRRIVRAYSLRYYAERTNAPYDPLTTAPLWHHSFLREVQVQGSCEEGLESEGQIPETYPCPSLPPMRLHYSPGALESNTFVPRSTLTGAPPNAEAENKVLPYLRDVAIVDFDRDGLPDVVEGWQSAATELCNDTIRVCTTSTRRS